jgi:hypothetical protein
MVRATAPSGLVHAMSRPIACLVVQGSKQVTMGTASFAFTAGDSLVITADVPIISEVTRANVAAPYMSLVMELDPAIIADLAVQMKAVPVGEHAPVRVAPTDAEAADAALRLVRLLDRPASLPVLQASLVRELHYWLLAGRHGSTIRRLGWPDSHAQRVARAVALLRAEFAHAAAGRTAGSDRRHERLLLPPAFPCRDISVAAAIPEASAADRSAAADAVRGSHRQQRRLCGRL